MAEKYITEEQRAGCRKVADAFAELYELTDVVVADAGRFGFVRLQWFSEGEGFDSAMAFSDSRELFEELWRIWYEHEVLTPVLGTPLAELDYDEIFQRQAEGNNGEKEVFPCPVQRRFQLISRYVSLSRSCVPAKNKL